uniref:Uncharacterized protein n=1 Tax=Arundo donax TaxID=35708 RepID=A0A0A8ZXG4_ARUDO
MTLRLELPKP